MWNKVSLRGRLTIFTALIIVAACVSLTIVSMFNVKRVFVNYYSYGGSPMAKRETHTMIVRTENGLPEDMPRKEFNRISIFYMCIFLVLGTALTYFFSGKALKPLHDLTCGIKEIDESNLKIRVSAKNSGAEILHLTESFNHMLSRLEYAFDSQRRFAQHAAHELKTPLSIMMTNIEVLQMDENPTGEEYSEVINIIKDSTERLIQVVSELLTLNASINPERIKTVDLYDVFQRIFTALSIALKEKKISVQNRCLSIVSGDPELLYHAFFNLVENAIKYNKPGGNITITSEDGYIMIEDTGIGIPEEDLANIFEPFYCVDPSRSRKYGGSGLGLSVVKAIIEKHMGTVRAESTFDQGTTVYVKLKNK